MPEFPLLGGRSNSQVTKINDIVFRSTGDNSVFVHKLLVLLEEKKFDFAPKFLGIDAQGREMLTYIEGDVVHDTASLSIEQLTQIIRILRSYHDATAKSTLAGDKEVVCHNDFAPWNTLWNDSTPVAIIDFDEAAPGNRIDDVAYFLWTFLELGSDNSVIFQASRIATLCTVYGNIDFNSIVEAILKQQKKILIKREKLAINDVSLEKRTFSAQKVIDIQNEMQWMQDNKIELEKNF